MARDDGPKQIAERPHDPYFARREEVRGTVGRLRCGNYLLTLLLAISLVGTGLATQGLAACAAKPSHVPVRVDVDRLGRVMAVGPISRLENPGHAIIEAELRRVIANLRVVYSADPLAQSDIQNAARERLRGEALDYVDQYFSSPATNPYELGRSMYRRVDVYRALPMPGEGGRAESWRLSWRETQLPVRGGRGEECEWEGIATVIFDPPQGDAVYKNPYGIWVVGLSWQQSSGCKPVADPVRRGRA